MAAEETYASDGRVKTRSWSGEPVVLEHSGEDPGT